MKGGLGFPFTGLGSSDPVLPFPAVLGTRCCMCQALSHTSSRCGHGMNLTLLQAEPHSPRGGSLLIPEAEFLSG